jgi:hypothetical protein
MSFCNPGLPAEKFKHLFELSDEELAEGAVRRIDDARSLARASCFDPMPCRNIAAKYPESTQRRKISIFRRLFNVVLCIARETDGAGHPQLDWRAVWSSHGRG